MAIARRPKRHDPKAERMTFTAEIERCLLCNEPSISAGSTSHSAKNVQTLEGKFYVVAYSRRCPTSECKNFGKHYHAAGHSKISLPHSTYGLDVVALVGIQRERKHEQFIEIEALLNERGVEIDDASVGRLYRSFLSLMEGAWPKRRERLVEAAEKYGGLVLEVDGLCPDGDGPQLYVLWEVLSGTPVLGMLIDKADEPHLTTWLRRGIDLIGELAILATSSDGEKALRAALEVVCPNAPHQLCQEHFMGNLSKPVQEEDGALREGLKEHLSPLPGVPNLDEEEARERIEHLVEQEGTPGKKGAWTTLPR
jgi:hypothetical protein